MHMTRALSLRIAACSLGLGMAAAAKFTETQYEPPATPPVWDSKGYILGCLCGGRFGNQFDSMLGFMEYAKQIDRTAVVGPWIEYNVKHETGQYPYFPAFSEFFDVERLGEYHRAIDMNDFLHFFADRWKEAGVVGYSALGESNFAGGAPRGPFWEHIFKKGGIPGFDKYVTFTAHHHQDVPPALAIEHPILALDCVPGRYPAPRHLDSIAQHFVWGGIIAKMARGVVSKSIGSEKFVAVHFRNEFGGGSGHCGGFSSVQCVEANGGSDELPDASCSPSMEEAYAALNAQLTGVGAKQGAISGKRTVFVASDYPLHDMDDGLKQALTRFNASLRPGPRVHTAAARTPLLVQQHG